MMEFDNKIKDFADAILKSAESQTIKKAVFSKSDKKYPYCIFSYTIFA